MYCSFKKLQIVWVKDGVRLNTSSHRKLAFTEDGWCSLTIFNCTANDTGLYLCTAHNVLGIESSQSMLTVADTAGLDSHLVTAGSKQVQYCKPRFTRAPGTVLETTEGSTVSFTQKLHFLLKNNVRNQRDPLVLLVFWIFRIQLAPSSAVY